ncbi:protein regulator of cytokinesis 1 [Drosophila mojavensis]|uniref:Uncharacterized protein n=1 Tax=Drosophila mojavensis TaxID=7230 RepID=B4L4N8_DROMO|nr:protein regulator of cytokinesis 1 [Drosophila mojavensis]EDW07516.1 uncharacterized protein Dmoj_GI14829 [Drosophila mojavensis]
MADNSAATETKAMSLELIDKLALRVKHLYSELSNTSYAKEDSLEYEIQSLLTEIDQMELELDLKVVSKDRRNNMATEIWLLTMDKELVELREELSKRIVEVENLLDQQKMFCSVLGEEPRYLNKMPKADEMSEIRDYVQGLRELHEARMNKVFNLRYSIQNEMNVLGIAPETEDEEKLLDHTDQCLTANVVETLTEMKTEVTDKIEGLHDDVGFLRKELCEKVDEMQALTQYLRSRIGKLDDSLVSFELLKQQLKSYDALQITIAKTVIQELRIEVEKYWDLTMKNVKYRNDFLMIVNDGTWEGALEKLEHEVDSLKDFYETNRRLYELYDCRKEFWERLVDLKDNDNDSDQDNRRNSPMEDLERTTINKMVQKLEEEITKLANEFLEAHNCPFKIYGKDILSVIADDWEKLRKKPTDGDLSEPTSPSPTDSSGYAPALTATPPAYFGSLTLVLLNLAESVEASSTQRKRKASSGVVKILECESFQNLTTVREDNTPETYDEPKRKKSKKDKKKKKKHDKRKYKHKQTQTHDSSSSDDENNSEPPHTGD